MKTRAALLGLALLAAACGRIDRGPSAVAPGPSGAAAFPAPAFTLHTLSGDEVRLADLRGRPVLIDFWATWCAPCERQVPVLNRFAEKYGERIPVLGISVDANPEAVPPFVATHDIRYRILLGDEGLARHYGARGFPTLFVVRPDGTVGSSHIGVVSPEALDEAVAEWTGAEPRPQGS